MVSLQTSFLQTHFHSTTADMNKLSEENKGQERILSLTLVLCPRCQGVENLV
jgi:hypothetical protein